MNSGNMYVPHEPLRNSQRDCMFKIVDKAQKQMKLFLTSKEFYS
jgi:hypothetical protein